MTQASFYMQELSLINRARLRQAQFCNGSEAAGGGGTAVTQAWIHMQEPSFTHSIWLRRAQFWTRARLQEVEVLVLQARIHMQELSLTDGVDS